MVRRSRRRVQSLSLAARQSQRAFHSVMHMAACGTGGTASLYTTAPQLRWGLCCHGKESQSGKNEPLYDATRMAQFWDILV